MTQSKMKRKSSLKNLVVDNSFIDAIVHSQQLTENEKLSFLRYTTYYNDNDKKELMQLI